jgi:hypothetical protein
LLTIQLKDTFFEKFSPCRSQTLSSRDTFHLTRASAFSASPRQIQSKNAHPDSAPRCRCIRHRHQQGWRILQDTATLAQASCTASQRRRYSHASQKSVLLGSRSTFCSSDRRWVNSSSVRYSASVVGSCRSWLS